MIVIDTSALMAIVLDEPDADRCEAALATAAALAISAGASAAASAEAYNEADPRSARQPMTSLIAGLVLPLARVR